MQKQYTVQRFRGKYALVYRDAESGRRHRLSLGTSDPREAEVIAPNFWGHLNRPKDTKVKDLWAAFVYDRQGRAIIRPMGDTWKVIKGRFGDKYPGDITVEDCREHIAARRSTGIGDGTIHTELGHLRMVLKWAVKRGLIQHAPYIEKPAKPTSKVVPLERDEVRKLIDAAQQPYLRLFIILAVTTAGRKSAVLELTWDRIDWKRNQINLDNPDITRPHKTRPWVPLNDMAREALLAVPESERTGRIIKVKGEGITNIYRGVAAASKRAGIPHVHPHKLRHTAAIHMLLAGVSLAEVAQCLGHKSIEITHRVYGRYQTKHLAAAASVLNY